MNARVQAKRTPGPRFIPHSGAARSCSLLATWCSVLASGLVAGAFVLGACAQKPPATVHLGYLPITFDLPTFVALDLGYFKEAGLAVEPTEMKSSNEAMNAIIAGQLDVQASIGFPTLFTVQEKQREQFFIILSGEETSANYGGAILVPKGSPLTSVADLKGKRIGTYTGLTQVLNAKIVLRKILDPDKDVTFVQIEPRLQLQGLETGQFDALFTIEPYPTIAVLGGTGRVLVDNPRVRYVMDPFPVAATITTTKFAHENPEAVQSLITALNRAVDYIQANEAGARGIMDKYLRTGPEVAGRVKLYHWSKLGSEDRAHVQELARLFMAEGLVKKDVDTAPMFLQAPRR